MHVLLDLIILLLVCYFSKLEYVNCASQECGSSLIVKNESQLITSIKEYDALIRAISTYEYCLLYSYDGSKVNMSDRTLYKTYLATLQALEDVLMVNPYINNNRIRMFSIDSSSKTLKDFVSHYEIDDGIEIICFYRGGVTSKFRVHTPLFQNDILNLLYKAFSFDREMSTTGKKRWSREQSNYIVENNCKAMDNDKTYLVRNVDSCACSDCCYSNTRVGINFGFGMPYNDWWWPGYGYGYGPYYGGGYWGGRGFYGGGRHGGHGGWHGGGRGGGHHR